MNVALVENAENDINRQQRGDDQNRLIGQRVLESGRGSLEAGVNGGGKANRLPSFHNGRGRLTEGDARRKIEGDRYRWPLPLMVDGQRSVGGSEVRES